MSGPAWAGAIGPGDELGGFVIEEIAGRGGMGVVYRAHQARPDRIVALKVIAPALAGDPAFRARFERESTIAAQIEHPNVIPVYAVGEHRGVLYIAMRFVAGIDLRTLIEREGKLEPMRAAAIVDQVAQALDAAHSHGLVHRDVKPANVLLSSAGDRDHAYLTDFGLSRHLEESRGVTGTGAFLGTIDYVAPEQARGERVDARTDVYSLGCVLFDALSGTVPFPMDNAFAKLYAHGNQQPPSICERDPDVPATFDPVLMRAMAKAPDDRHPSAGDLGRAALAAAANASPPRSESSVAVGAAAPVDANATAPRPATREPDDTAQVTEAPDASAGGEGRRDGAPPAARDAGTAVVGDRDGQRPGAPRRRGRIAALLGLLALVVVVAVVLLSGNPASEPSSGGAAKAGEIAVAKPGATPAPVHVAIDAAGRQRTLTFQGAKDQLIAPDVRNVSVPAEISVVDPADETVLGPWAFKSPSLLRTERCESPAGCQPLKLKRSGTHRLVVRGDGDATGSFDLRLYGVAPDDERDRVVGGPPVILDLGVGQLATVTFPSSPGRIVLRLTDIELDAGYVSVRGPGDQAVLKETGFDDSKGTVAFRLTLPRAGSYVVYVRGNDLSSGPLTVALQRP